MTHKLYRDEKSYTVPSELFYSFISSNIDRVLKRYEELMRVEFSLNPYHHISAVQIYAELWTSHYIEQFSVVESNQINI